MRYVGLLFVMLLTTACQEQLQFTSLDKLTDSTDLIAKEKNTKVESGKSNQESSGKQIVSSKDSSGQPVVSKTEETSGKVLVADTKLAIPADSYTKQAATKVAVQEPVLEKDPSGSYMAAAQKR